MSQEQEIGPEIAERPNKRIFAPTSSGLLYNGLTCEGHHHGPDLASSLHQLGARWSSAGQS